MYVVTLARKPLVGTVAFNVLGQSTGALNIAASRIGTGEDKGVWPVTNRKGRNSFNSANDGSLNKPVETDKTVGRWPANLVLGTPEVVLELGQQSGFFKQLVLSDPTRGLG